MCGRFYLTATPGEIARRFGAPPAQGGGRLARYNPIAPALAAQAGEPAPASGTATLTEGVPAEVTWSALLDGEGTRRFNIAPTQTIVIVTDEGKREQVEAVWGLIPSWAKGPSVGGKLINARAETLAEKPAFRSALRRRRCLIPASGFFEWPFKDSKDKMRISLVGGEPFAFAGLWETWRAPDGTEVRSCTIVTQAPNALMKRLHHRMPVLLTKEAEDLWMDHSITDPDVLRLALAPIPAERLVAVRVGPRGNDVSEDDEAVILPLPGFEPLTTTDDPPS